MANEISLLIKARDEATAVLKNVAGEVNVLNSTVARLSTGLGVWGLMAAGVSTVASAAVAAGKRFSDNVERLDRLHDATGVSIKDLQVLDEVFKTTGLSAEQADVTVTKFTKAIGEGDPVLKRIVGNTRDVRQALAQVADWFARTGDAAAREAVAFKLFGKTAAEVPGIIAALGTTMDATEAKMRRAGALIGDDTAAKARELDKALDDLGIRWDGLWTQMLTAALPAASKIVDALTSIWDKANQTFDSNSGLLGWFKEARREQNEWEKSAQKTSDDLQKAIDGGWTFGSDVHPRTPPVSPKSPNPFDDDSRKKRLQEIQRVLGVSLPIAKQYLDELNRIEDASKSADLTKKLGIGVFAAGRKDLENIPDRELQPRGASFDVLKGFVGVPDQKKILEDFLATHQAMSEGLIDLGLKYGDLARTILSTSGLVDASLNALWNGLESGFADSLQHMRFSTLQLGREVQTVLRSVAREAESLLAHIGATLSFQFLGGLIPGLGPLLKATGATPKSATGPVVVPSGVSAGGARTVIINGYDVRSAYEDLLNGKLGEAQVQIQANREY